MLGPLYFHVLLLLWYRIFGKNPVIQNVGHMAFRILKIKVRRHLTTSSSCHVHCVGINVRQTGGGDKDYKT